MTNYLFSKFGKLHLIHASDRKDIMKVRCGHRKTGFPFVENIGSLQVLATVTYLRNYEDPDDFSCVIKLFDYLRVSIPFFIYFKLYAL